MSFLVAAIPSIWSAVVAPAAAAQTPTASAAKPDDGSADRDGGTDDDDKAPQGTGHGKAKTGEPGLLGDVAGMRPVFARHGVTFDLSETAEAIRNPTGGKRQGAIAEGLLALSVDVDVEKAAGLKGTKAHVSVFSLEGGPGLSASDVGNFNVVSDIEDKRDSGLYEAWIEQAFGPAFDMRVGRLSADEDFMLVDSADLFMNGSFGWPTLPFKDLPNGGPIPADAAVRAHLEIDTAWDALVGLYRGSQSDTAGASGAASTSHVSTDDGLFAIAELQYATGQGQGELPATYKVGGWYRDGDAMRADSAGRVSPFETLPAIVRQTMSLYAIADHRLTRGAGDEDSGFSAFLRLMAAPSDRNIVTAFADAGLVYSGPFGRKDDGVGLGVAVAQTSATPPDPGGRMAVRLGRPETSLEATYQAQLATGIQLQPDLQYVIDPAGGHITRAGHLLGDALVLGLRTTIVF